MNVSTIIVVGLVLPVGIALGALVSDWWSSRKAGIHNLERFRFSQQRN